MKSFYLVLLLHVFTWYGTIAQIPAIIDSLTQLLSKTKEDTIRVNLLVRLAMHYSDFKPDSAKIFSKQALHLSQKIHFTKGEANALNEIGREFRYQGEYPQALEAHFNALQVSKGNYPRGEAASLMYIGNVYREVNEYGTALIYYNQAKKIYGNFSIQQGLVQTLGNIAETYERMNRLDSALSFLAQAQTLAASLNMNNQQIMRRFGDVQLKTGNYLTALSYYKGVIRSTTPDDFFVLAITQYKMAQAYFQLGQEDSSIYYAKLAFLNSKKVSYKRGELDGGILLAKLYKSKNNLDSAYYYQDMSIRTKDSMFGPEKFQRLQMLTFKEQQHQQQILQHQKELEQEQEQLKNKIRLYALLATLGVFLLLATMLYRNNRQKQKANALLHYQKSEIQNALTELKSTQAQLIQSEKMASLGELTAGIAHEIQNPLNFVNNFSEVNTELIDEAGQEIQKGNINEVKIILNDIKENEQKINHHGKRADAIVKGMLATFKK